MKQRFAADVNEVEARFGRVGAVSGLRHQGAGCGRPRRPWRSRSPGRDEVVGARASAPKGSAAAAGDGSTMSCSLVPISRCQRVGIGKTCVRGPN